MSRRSMQSSRRCVRISRFPRQKPPREMTQYSDQPKARGLQSSGFCLLLALVLVGCSAHATKPPTVFLLDAPKVADSRQRIRKGDHTLDPAVEKLKHDADTV